MVAGVEEITRARSHLKQRDANRTSQHYTQLDGLRCFAAVVVIWQHSAAPLFPTFGQSGFGVYGVWLFFVLSGFLITGILLRVRDEGLSTGPALKAFYARRFLRIVPLYVVVVLTGALFGIGASFRRDLVWHLAYLTNWLYALRGAWGDVATPLWSLAIEEQFYIVWPLLILLTPRKYLRYLLVTVIAIGPVARLVFMLVFGALSVRMLTPTPSEFDALGLGAMLAAVRHDDTISAYAGRFARTAGYVGLAGLILVGVLSFSRHGWRLMCVIEAGAVASLSTWLVQTAATGFGQSGAGRVMRSVLVARPVLHLGRISYGLYLLHSPVIWALERSGISRLFGATSKLSGTAYFVLVLAATTMLATLSWRVLERPINGLKRYFVYG